MGEQTIPLAGLTLSASCASLEYPIQQGLHAEAVVAVVVEQLGPLGLLDGG